MAITNQLEIVQPWESLSVAFLSDKNLAIFKHLCQSANVWHCGELTKQFYNPNKPTSTIGDWQIIPTKIWGLIDLKCQGHLFCFMVGEMGENNYCPIDIEGRVKEVNQRLCEWLAKLVEEV